MDLNRALKTVGIGPIRSLSFVEMNQIIQNFVEQLVITFPNQKLKYQEIVAKMFECHMYVAHIPENLGTANYFYKNQAIYYKEGTNFKQLDDYIVHECLHYFQDGRKSGDPLERMGLCTFQEFKIYCMALNESAVQYITSKILKRNKVQIKYAGIVLDTRSPNYFPLLCNLIEQMVFLIGENALVDSVLFSNEHFAYSFMDVAGENALKEIQAGFDTLLELKQNNNEELEKQEILIKQQYEKIQNLILTSYFDGAFTLLETIEEIEEYKQLLEDYKKYLGNVDNYYFYEQYKEKQLDKLDKKAVTISRRNSKDMLAVISNNKIFAFFRAIRNLIFKGKEEYKLK